MPAEFFVYYLYLGSSSIELDENANLISYEEYHPFGTTSYRSGRSAAEVSLKRYRYTGKEKDEETGLHYHGARYYAPWIGRWTSVDPVYDLYYNWSPYNYTLGNPIKFIDPNGMWVGDYYNWDGIWIGNDGIDDDRVYVVGTSENSSLIPIVGEGNVPACLDMFYLNNNGFYESHDGVTYNAFEAVFLPVQELPMGHSKFKDLTGTLYAEGSSTFSEAAGIYSVLENRAKTKGVSTHDIASSSSEGIYGWGGKEKINSSLANKAWVKNANKAVIDGCLNSKDYSNGAYFWHGTDLKDVGSPAYNEYYSKGLNFTNSSHDLWKLGSKTSGKSNYSYKYQTTGAAGKTTFMTITNEWKKAVRYTKKY